MTAETLKPKPILHTTEIESEPTNIEEIKKIAQDFYRKSLALKVGETAELIVNDEAILGALVREKGYREIYSVDDSSQFLAARLSRGFVEFDVKTETNTPKSPYLWASDFFLTAIEYYKSQGEVLGMTGSWPSREKSVNSQMFWDYLIPLFQKKGAVDEQDVDGAIKSTWTAQQANKAGLSVTKLLIPDLDFINTCLRENRTCAVRAQFVEQTPEELS